MRCFLSASLTFVALCLACGALAEESSESRITPAGVMNALDGWDWFETHRRETHPVLAKLDPYLAREWWQREHPGEELYPGRGAVRLDTGIQVDAKGMTPVSIILFEAEAWAQVAPLILPNGTATLYPVRGPSQTSDTVEPPDSDEVSVDEGGASEGADLPDPLPSGGAGIDDLVMVPPRRAEVPINIGPLKLPSPESVDDVELGPMSVPPDLGGGYLVAATVSIGAVYRIAAHSAVKAVVQRFPGQNGISFDVGSRTTQGVETHRTDTARSMFPSETLRPGPLGSPRLEVCLLSVLSLAPPHYEAPARAPRRTAGDRLPRGLHQPQLRPTSRSRTPCTTLSRRRASAAGSTNSRSSRAIASWTRLTAHENSWWVHKEVQRSLRKEKEIQRRAGRRVRSLIPLTIDEFAF